MHGMDADDIIRFLQHLVQVWGPAALTVTVPDLWQHSNIEKLGDVRLLYTRTREISFSVLTMDVQLRYTFDPAEIGIPVPDRETDCDD